MTPNVSEKAPFDALSAKNLSDFNNAPQVQAPDRPWVTPLGVVLALALGVIVFWQLSAERARSEPVATVPAAPVRPVAPLPERHPSLATAAPTPAPVAPAPSSSASASDQARLQAPALIVDLSEAQEEGANNRQGAGASAAAIAGAVGGLSGDERFASRFDTSGAAHAHRLDDPATTVAQGSIIAAVLETAVDSDLPGYARALVTRDVRGFDGEHVLVPRGSRLIGQYRSGLALGTSRIYVIWSRLIRPDGVSIDLNSPGADALGRGGLAGETDTHFLARFGGAILLSLIGVAGDAAAGGDNTQVIIGMSRGGESAAAAAVGQEVNIPPTVRISQGAPIRVFVVRDLDFSTSDDAPP